MESLIYWVIIQLPLPTSILIYQCKSKIYDNIFLLRRQINNNLFDFFLHIYLHILRKNRLEIKFNDKDVLFLRIEMLDID